MSAEQLKVNNLRRSSITEQKSRHCLDFLDVTIYNYHIPPSFLVRAAISSAISSEERFLHGKRQAGEM